MEHQPLRGVREDPVQRQGMEVHVQVQATASEELPEFLFDEAREARPLAGRRLGPQEASRWSRMTACNTVCSGRAADTGASHTPLPGVPHPGHRANAHQIDTAAHAEWRQARRSAARRGEGWQRHGPGDPVKPTAPDDPPRPPVFAGLAEACGGAVTYGRGAGRSEAPVR
jgi:hypothetical protein